MTAIPGTIVLALFFMVAWIIFSGLLDVTNDQSDSLRESNERQEDRLRTLISINCTSGSTGDYTLGVLNSGNRVSFADFSKLDFLARYTNATGDVVAKRLVQTSDFVVSSITGDTTDPRIWDPGETAHITFTLDPQPGAGSKGTIALAVPQGISDTAYFDASGGEACQRLYWHNDPTPPTTDTASHAVLTADRTRPTATTLFNYDTDRDSCTGLTIVESTGLVDEADTTKFQVWRTASLDSKLVISGDVTVDFWSATRRYNCTFPDNRAGSVNIFLRDRDTSGAYTEIGSGDISESDWQGGASDFVEKTITISDIHYNIQADHQLEVKVLVDTVQAPATGIWFAYDTTTYISVVNLP